MFEPLKVGFGEYMGRFYDSILPTTKPLNEYIARGLSKSIVFAPSKMVDNAQELLNTWQRNNTNDTSTQPSKLPVIIVGIASNYMPTGRDFSIQVIDPEYFIFPDDTKERVFKLGTSVVNRDAQIAIFSADEPTTMELARQLNLFLDANGNRRFNAAYKFAGFQSDFPVQIEDPATAFIHTNDPDIKNVSGVACSLTFQVTIPLFSAPKVGSENDGKGVPETDDPAGYPVVTEVLIDFNLE